MKDSAELDPISWQILIALQENARVSYTDLGRVVGLSPPAVAERVRRLEEDGIITGYSATINHERLGLGITAFVRTQTFSEEAFHGVLEALADTPAVLELHHVTGDDCNVAKVVARSISHLEQILATFARYGRTTSAIVLSSRVKGRTLVPEHLAPPVTRESGASAKASRRSARARADV